MKRGLSLHDEPLSESTTPSETHTAGPWRVVTEAANAGLYRGTNFYICGEGELPESQIARVNIQDSLNEQSANARLIASAPDLMKALENQADLWDALSTAFATEHKTTMVVSCDTRAKSLRDLISRAKGPSA